MNENKFKLMELVDLGVDLPSSKPVDWCYSKTNEEQNQITVTASFKEYQKQ